MSEKVQVVEFLLSKGADPNLQNSMGETPLHYAADNSLLEIAKLLCQHQADPNVPNTDGETALFQAVYRDHLEMLQLLLEHGANPNLVCSHLGRSPLHYAIAGGHVDTARLLGRIGASAVVSGVVVLAVGASRRARPFALRPVFTRGYAAATITASF